MPEINADFILALAALLTAAGGLIKVFRDANAQRTKNADLTKRVRKLEEENGTLHNDVDGLVKTLGERDEKLDTLQDSYDFLKKQYDTLYSKYETLLAHYDALKAQYDALKLQYDALCSENSDLKKQLASVKKQTGGLKQ